MKIIIFTTIILGVAFAYYIHTQDYLGTGSEIPVVNDKTKMVHKHINSNTDNTNNTDKRSTEERKKILLEADEDIFTKAFIELGEDIDDLAYEFDSTMEISLYNVHTKESINSLFWKDGKYIQEELFKLNQFMRDWRQDQTIKVDPKLYTLLYDLYNEVGATEPISLISGFRSESTNNKLRKMGRNTAKKSQHVQGRAADIYIPGVAVKELREEALELERGGVGYYPKNSFVHVDTGRVRQW